MKIELNPDINWAKKPIGLIEIFVLLLELICLILGGVGGFGFPLIGATVTLYGVTGIGDGRHKAEWMHNNNFQVLVHGAFFTILFLRIVSYLFEGGEGKMPIQSTAMCVLGAIFHIAAAIAMFCMTGIGGWAIALTRAIFAFFIGLLLLVETYFVLKGAGLIK